MDYTVADIRPLTDKPFVYVDFNELIDADLIMLSQGDSKNDYFGNPVLLRAGLELAGYQADETAEGLRDDLIVEGTCILNHTGYAPHVKWLLRFNSKGIRYASSISRQGW